MNLLLTTTGGAIVDIVALILFVGFAINGAKKGFIKSLISTFGSIISLFVAILLCSSVANFLENQFGFATQIGSWLNGGLTKIFGHNTMNLTLEQAKNGGLSASGISGLLLSMILRLKTDIPLDTPIGNLVAPMFGYYLLCALSIIALYIILRLILFIIGDIAQKSHKIKISAILDGTLGLVFGLIKCTISIYLMVLLINAIPLQFMQNIALYIKESTITSFVARTNLLGLLFDFMLGNGINNYISTIF